MFVDELKRTFGINTPILVEEIVEHFNQYSRAYVFRLIRKSLEQGQLACFSRGVYYIPQNTFFGASTLCSEMVAEKKYLKDQNSVYGVCAGLTLLNQFGLTTQVPNITEIVTNNETTRKRSVVIEGREFILRKARCLITKDNYPEYTLLQLFSDMNLSDKLNDFVQTQVKQYIQKNGITEDKLFSMAMVFPSATAKKMLGSGVLNGTI